MPTVPHASIIATHLDMKGLKTWSSRDGGGYQYTLLHHGKAVATVTNEGNGGSIKVDWLNMTWDGRVSHGYNPTPAQVKKANAQYPLTVAAKAALDALVAAQPPYHAYGMDLKVDADMVFEELINIAATRKAIRTKTLFQVNGKVYEIKAAYDAKVAAYIKTKYPTAIIANEDPVYTVAA